ncbi:MAG: CocE/NonD family hydrolase [Pseudanabaenaceae cyanobacterium]
MWHDRILVQRKIKIPMRDGVQLTADIYRPKNVDTPLPVLLMRLPYGRAIASTVVYKHPSWYADQGYIVVIQEVRGTGNSEGKFYPFKYEYNDGFDTVEWCIQTIPNNNGKLGMYGFSYQGVTQLQTAVTQPQGLVTICPCMASADLYEGFLYWGGALCWEFVLTWAVQLTQIRAQSKKLEPEATRLLKYQTEVKEWLHFLPIDQIPILKDEPLADFFFDWINHPTGAEAYWQELNPLSYFSKYDLPALHIAGWADIFIKGTITTWQEAKKCTKQPQYLLVPPYAHFPWTAKIGDLDFGIVAYKDIDKIQIAWFDYWLKGMDNGIISSKPVQLFLMQKNQWLELDNLPTQQLILYLGANFSLHFSPQDSHSLPDIFVYDPCVPTPGGSYFTDHASISQRWDILVYKTDPLIDKIDVIGEPVMYLSAVSSSPQNDWVIKLLDIDPDGREILVTMGVLRSTALPETNQIYLIKLNPTAYTFLTGHRIGLGIACGAFPTIDRQGVHLSASDFCSAIQQVNFSQCQLSVPVSGWTESNRQQ